MTSLLNVTPIDIVVLREAISSPLELLDSVAVPSGTATKVLLLTV